MGAGGKVGTAMTAGRTLSALALPGLNFGPGLTVAGAGAARETVSAEPESGGPDTKVTEAIPLASAEEAFAAAGAIPFCARTILGAEQMMARAISATADVMNASHVFARRGDVFRCVLSIISILSFS